MKLTLGSTVTIFYCMIKQILNYNRTTLTSIRTKMELPLFTCRVQIFIFMRNSLNSILYLVYANSVSD